MKPGYLRPGIEGWLNRHITHTRDVEGDYGVRFCIHIPLGIAIGFLGRTLAEAAFHYEDNECLHTHDQAWKDYAGIIAGIITGRTLLIAGFAWLAIYLIGRYL